MALPSYRIALPAMIKRKLTRCCAIMNVTAVASFDFATCNRAECLNRKIIIKRRIRNAKRTGQPCAPSGRVGPPKPAARTFQSIRVSTPASPPTRKKAGRSPQSVCYAPRIETVKEARISSSNHCGKFVPQRLLQSKNQNPSSRRPNVSLTS